MKWWRVAAFHILAVVCALSAGCSRETGFEASSAETPAGKPLPFSRTSPSYDQAGVSPTGALGVVSLPAGTALTVRTQAALSSATAKAGDPFTAVLDAPATLDGQIIVPAGATVRGKVIATEPAAAFGQSGYLRLTLTEVSVRGKAFSVETSSVFVKGARRMADTRVAGSDSGGAGPAVSSAGALVPAAAKAGQMTARRGDVELPVSRLLTFRLSQPVLIQN